MDQVPSESSDQLPVTSSSEANSLLAKSPHQLDRDRALRLNKKEGRLIRHMYRKIRAHPELAQEFVAAMSN